MRIIDNKLSVKLYQLINWAIDKVYGSIMIDDIGSRNTISRNCDCRILMVAFLKIKDH